MQSRGCKCKLIFSAFDKNAEEDFTHRNERDFSIDYLKISVVWYYSNLNQQKISFVAPGNLK